jgi:hypothetical protein
MPTRPGSYHTESAPGGLLYKDTQYSNTSNSQDKLLSYRPVPPQDHQFNPLQRPPGTSGSTTMHAPAPVNLTSAPDTLTKAFNEAIKPYVDQIETLKQELEEKEMQLQQLEEERADMHAWIDKRGLRAGRQCVRCIRIAPVPLGHHHDRSIQ